MIARLALVTVLLLPAAASMAEETRLIVKAKRDDTNIRIVGDGTATVIDVTSPFGIDRAAIKRTADQWPETIVVRMHLRGLEMFSAGGNPDTVEWSVASSGDHSTRVSLRTKQGEIRLDDNSPYVTEVRVVGGERKIPLERGHFEIRLPPKLFDGNPAQIELSWIDFYRR